MALTKKERNQRYYQKHRERLRTEQAAYHTRNAEHIHARSRQWKKDNPERAYAKQLWLTHELTPEELHELGWCCAVCGTTEALAVDHNHDCTHPRLSHKSVVSCKDCHRGRLCSGCNKALGFLGDSPERAESAARYLRETRETEC